MGLVGRGDEGILMEVKERRGHNESRGACRPLERPNYKMKYYDRHVAINIPSSPLPTKPITSPQHPDPLPPCSLFPHEPKE